MADAWPMIAACKEAQWRGLDQLRRTMSGIAWDSDTFPLEAGWCGEPIWTIESDGRTLVLIAMKLG